MNNYNNNLINSQALNILTLTLQTIIETEFQKYRVAQQELHTGIDGKIDKNYHVNNSTDYKMVSKYGVLNLKIPRLRKPLVKFIPSIFESNFKSSFALEPAVCLLYGLGMTCTSISYYLKEIFQMDVSKSKISTITHGLDNVYDKFINSNLKGIKCSIMYIDSTYFKVKVDGIYRSIAYHIVIALDESGHKQIVFAAPKLTESSHSWNEVFSNLKSRGLTNPKIIVVDGCTGSHLAISTSYPNSKIQSCLFHLVANIRRCLKDNFEKRDFKILTEKFFSNEISFDEFKIGVYERFPNYHLGFDCLFKQKNLRTYEFFNQTSWKYIQTNNSIESVNQEFKTMTSAHKSYGSFQGLNRALITVINRINANYESNDDYQLIQIVEQLHELSIINKEYKYKIVIQQNAKKHIIKFTNYNAMQSVLKLID